MFALSCAQVVPTSIIAMSTGRKRKAHDYNPQRLYYPWNEMTCSEMFSKSCHSHCFSHCSRDTVALCWWKHWPIAHCWDGVGVRARARTRKKLCGRGQLKCLCAAWSWDVGHSCHRALLCGTLFLCLSPPVPPPPLFSLALTLISSLINIVLVSDLQQRRRLYISFELSGHPFKIYMNNNNNKNFCNRSLTAWC